MRGQEDKGPAALLDGPLDDALAALAAGRTTSEALTRATLDRIDARDAVLNAYVRVDAEGALAAADASDRRRARGEAPRPLEGLPVAVKDLLVTEGLETTAGSRILEGHRPVYDATAVARLREAGAVLVGKNNLDEFAMGSSSEHSAWGPTRNPFDPARVPGGSSGGSAAAVAAGLAFASLGTDTGGSIRQPASFCGVVGLKPTYGRVSRYGAIAYASSLDQIGPLCRTVRGAARVLEVIGGPDPRDSTSLGDPVGDLTASLDDGVAGLRVGLCADALAADGLDPAVAERVRAAADGLAAAGAELVEVALPTLPYGIAAYYLTATAEASSNLARYDGVRYGARAGDGDDLATMYRATRSAGFGREVKRRILLGTYALSSGYYEAFYLKARAARARIAADYAAAFERCDVLCLPTSPVPPFRLGERLDDPLAMYLADLYTIGCNLAGLPGISVPAGQTADGLPIGVQLLAPRLAEATLLRAARACEIATGGFVPPPEGPR